MRFANLNRGASPLGLPDTLSRTPLRRRAPFAWLARDARSRVIVLPTLLALSLPSGSELGLTHRQRYAMGTMFDVLVYHESSVAAGRAADQALDEVVRLDRILSHFDEDSDLSTLVKDGRTGFVRVDSRLYEVLRESKQISELSGGKFDVTIGPLVQLWKQARLESRVPSEAEITAAKRCVGFEKIELRAPDLVRLRSDCAALDLGGIGKGYAIDRAIAILKSCGISRALINAGSSSIAAIGAPPDRAGWPVDLASSSDAPRLLLKDTSISTSQQPDRSGDIVDPQAARPIRSRLSVSVVAPRATVSDAISTAVLLLPVETSRQLLARFDGVSAYWVSADGRLEGSHPDPRSLSRSR
jgi:thiamine biosynthesis lipoprotein